MKKINVEKYNPNWKVEFQKAKTFFQKLLTSIDVEIVHVGSTSVEGLWAKPILDIDIIVKNTKDRDDTIRQLENVGYKHRGDLGINGREAFNYTPDNPNIQWMKHHLYLCIAGNENLNNHLLLKKHLQENKKAVEEYSHLKQELAKKYPYDIDAYVEGKTAFITRILGLEGMNAKALVEIEEANKKK